MPLTKQEIRTDAELKADRFSVQDIKEFRETEALYFKLATELDDAERAKNYDKILDLEDRVFELECRLRYQGRDTRDVPLDTFKKLLHEGQFKNSDTRTAFQRIKNPATAMRAYCVFCMGGQAVEVKRCQSYTCPLWPFRMGQNPFYGKTLPPLDYDIKLDDSSEDVVVEEDSSEGIDDANTEA